MKNEKTLETKMATATLAEREKTPTERVYDSLMGTAHQMTELASRMERGGKPLGKLEQALVRMSLHLDVAEICSMIPTQFVVGDRRAVEEGLTEISKLTRILELSEDFE